MLPEILRHVKRMNGSRYSKITLLGGVHKIRQRERLKKHWIENKKKDCGTLGMTITQHLGLPRIGITREPP